jgi:hypothetical protein
VQSSRDTTGKSGILELLDHFTVWIDADRVNNRGRCHFLEHPSRMRCRFIDEGLPSVKQLLELYAYLD